MLTEKNADFGRGSASFFESKPANAAQPTLHFSAANGFPVAAYQHFLGQLDADFHIVALENRGIWSTSAPPARLHWNTHADDIIALLDYRRRHGLDTAPAIAIGHSIGGTVSALAASKRPDLFRALIMIDPATPPGRYMWRLPAPVLRGILRKHRLVTSARNRRHQWQSIDEFHSSMRSKSIYKTFTEQAMHDYAQAALKQADDGHLQLRYDPHWEAQNFLSSFAPWRALRTIRVPTLLLRADLSYMHPPGDFDYLTRKLAPFVDTASIKGVGHMAIQEDPDQVLQLCTRWLSAQALLNG